MQIEIDSNVAKILPRHSRYVSLAASKVIVARYDVCGEKGDIRGSTGNYVQAA
jgi:hypothetical protein